MATGKKFLPHNFIRCLRDGVGRKRPEKLRTDGCVFLHNNASAHRPVLVKDFVAKNNMTTLEPLPYSLDLAAPDSFMFL